MKWNELLNPTRRKDLESPHGNLGTAAGRTELERDYDRILFLSATRRLADKTQVFPLDKHDSVRTRLTHSHEVSNLARSIGVRISFDFSSEVFGDLAERLSVTRVVPPTLAAIALAHDLGNPPFGHQGERAMRDWFKKLNKCRNDIPKDFLNFDGNAQTFRLLTKLQIIDDKFGINLCIGTLAALIKYPAIYGTDVEHPYKKEGIFQSEKEIAKQVWLHTGLKEGLRHPLTYIMEACDDIAYSVIDAEDIVKKGYASFYDLMDALGTCESEIAKEVHKKSLEQNAKFKPLLLSSNELNDKSMQMFRVIAISKMVECVTEQFVEDIDEILLEGDGKKFSLIENSSASELCEKLKEFDKRFGFENSSVLKLELEGSNHISSIMTMLWEAIITPEAERSAFHRYIFSDISENYRRVYEKTDQTIADKCHLLCDAVSGMTDSFLINKNREYNHLFES